MLLLVDMVVTTAPEAEIFRIYPVPAALAGASMTNMLPLLSVTRLDLIEPSVLEEPTSSGVLQLLEVI